MFDVDSLTEELKFEMSLTTGLGSETDMVIETLLKNYVVPSFNRDYPQIMTVIIRDQSRFYPYFDLTGGLSDKFLSHIFLIKQDRAMYTWLQTQMGVGEADNFVTVVSTDLVQKIIRFSYKENSFVSSPMVLYDDTRNSSYYMLDPYSRYILIYNILNSINSRDPMSPMDYEVLKQYAGWKISEFLIANLDMSTVGVLNEYLGKVMEGIRNSDSTKLFNPSVSNLSFGGEISIGFNPQGTLTQAVQQAIPMIRSGYSEVQKSLLAMKNNSYKRFQNLLKRRYYWLYMV